MAFAKKSLSLAVLVSVGVFAACADGGNDDGLPPAPPPGTNQAAQGVALPALKPGGQLATPLAARGNAAARTTLAPVEQEVVVQLRSQPGRRIDGQRLLSARLDRAARQIRTPRKPANLAGVARPELFTVEVDKASGRTVDDVIRELKQMPEVEFAEPNYRYETSLTPNDPLYGSQLQFEPIRAPQAWDVTTGSSSVVVAVIDTGVELTHPDLAANIWRNPGEIAGDGLDNDQNGFVDDVTGYDFVSATTDVASGEDPGPPDNDPADFQGHGTHVAGIVGAVGNDGNGVTGVAWTVKLMPLRAGYLHSSGVGTLLLSDIANALHYAADKGAHVVNMSFGGSQPSQILADALRYAADRGVLLIAAAGNTGTSVPQFPASYDRVLSVAATEGNALALFSSFGMWVDIAAPGVNVLSTYLGGSTAFLSGTSMASPVVAGTAALVRASHPTWTAQQIAEKLTSTASATASGWKRPFGAGLTDAGAAVTAPAALATFDTVGVQFEELSGDGDGNPEAGETGRLYATIKNYGPAGSAIVSLQTTEPGVTVSGSPATLQAFGPTRLATASFGFTLPSNLPVNRSVTFNVTVTSGSRSFTDAVALDPVRWAPPRILAERFSWNQIITGLPNGSVAVVAELEGVGGTFTTIGGIVKSPTGQWPALTQLSGPTDAVRPNVRVAPDGGLDVTFERSVGQFNYQIFYRRYTASSASWGPEEQVTTNATLHLESFDHVRTNHAVARDSTGRLHVAWIDSAGLPRTLRYTTRSSSSAWSAPVTLTTFPETDLLEAKLEMFVLPDG
ncbi:MAG TPA: S8 family serine peptidase, partial [Polyangiaceae bacterium]